MLSERQAALLLREGRHPGADRIERERLPRLTFDLVCQPASADGAPGVDPTQNTLRPST